MAKETKIEFLTLGCTFAKGRYPKLKTTRLKHGLRFLNGMLKVTNVDFEELEKNIDFMMLYQKTEIFKMRPGQKPKSAIVPRVVHGSTTATQNAPTPEESSQPAVQLEGAEISSDENKQ